MYFVRKYIIDVYELYNILPLVEGVYGRLPQEEKNFVSGDIFSECGNLP